MTVRSSDGGVRDVILGAGGGGLGVRDIMANDWGGCICVYWNCLMEGEVSNGHHLVDSTHVKDLKDILEAQPPGSDRLFIFLRTETPIDHAPSIPLRELPPNICYGPAIESIRTNGRDACRWFNSHRQLIYRTVHGPTELARFLSIRPLVKYSADIGTE